MWAGWESDTYRLQEAGWQLSAEQDITSLRCRFAFKHPNFRIYGLSNLINYAEFYDSYSQDKGIFRQLPPLVIQYMASRMEIILYENFKNFQPIDAQPSIITEEKKNIEDFMIFRPIGNTKELIVTPQQVPELLDLIIAKQDPKQKEIREKKRKEWRKFAREINETQAISIEEEIDPRKNIVAQLITV